MLRVLISTNLPAPYSVDFFNLLGKKCDLTVAFFHRSDAGRDPSWFSSSDQNYKAVYLREKNGKNPPFSLLPHVFSRKYDVYVMYGYASAPEIVANLALRTFGKGFIISADGAVFHAESELKRRVKQTVISGADCFLSPNEETDRYFLYYGVDRNKLRRYHFTSLFEKDILPAPVSGAEKAALREKLGIGEKTVIVSVGSFIRRKGFDVLLNAWDGADGEAGLYIIGGNPTEEYKAIVRDRSLRHVHFVGHLGKEALCEYYRAADLSVFPTRYDIWGLVVNEALAKGLPVISTDRCGAALELIRDGVNGWVVPAEDGDALREKTLEYLNLSEDKKSAMAENALASIREYTMENMAEEYYEAIQDFYQRHSGSRKAR